MIGLETAEQYARMTLRQYGVARIRIEWMESCRFLGLAYVESDMIKLSLDCLNSFNLFNEVLLHEIAHFLDYHERGTFKVNGKNVYHGKNWKKHCRNLKIPARRFIPVFA